VLLTVVVVWPLLPEIDASSPSMETDDGEPLIDHESVTDSPAETLAGETSNDAIDTPPPESPPDESAGGADESAGGADESAGGADESAGGGEGSAGGSAGGAAGGSAGGGEEESAEESPLESLISWHLDAHVLRARRNAPQQCLGESRPSRSRSGR
jgi:hypothetical protein